MLHQNRAFKYGDGLFETIRVRDQQALHLNHHFARLSKGLRVLQMQTVANSLSFNDFSNIINGFIAESSNANLRIRITFFRRAGGLYTPQQHEFNYHIESTALEDRNYLLNKKGYSIGVCDSVRLSMDTLSNLKTTSALSYVVAGLEKKAAGWDDCLLLNAKNRIAESIAANVFLIKENSVYTPPLTEGCVQGVMRSYLVEQLQKDTQFNLVEQPLYLQDILAADELFFTNAIRGIQWIRFINGSNKEYQLNKIRTIYERYLLV